MYVLKSGLQTPVASFATNAPPPSYLPLKFASCELFSFAPSASPGNDQ